MADEGSIALVKKLWEDWAKRESGGQEYKTEQLAKAFVTAMEKTADRKSVLPQEKKQALMTRLFALEHSAGRNGSGEDVKDRHYKVPSSDNGWQTVMGWVGERGSRVVTRQYRAAALWAFFGEDWNTSKAGVAALTLVRAWIVDSAGKPRPEPARTAEAVFGWAVTDEHSTEGLADIILSDPVRGNPAPDEPDHYVLNAQLFMGVLEKVKDGKRRRVGASKIIARVTSDDWQPVKASRLGEQEKVDHVRYQSRAFEFGGPIDPDTGCLRGDLLDRPLLKVSQKPGSSGEAPIQVSLAVPPLGFVIAEGDAAGGRVAAVTDLDARQAILNRMLQTKFCRNFDDREVRVASAKLSRVERERS
jgi:hypothetical protein